MDSKDVAKNIGSKEYSQLNDYKNTQVGIVNALVSCDNISDSIIIEVNVLDGKGSFDVTGNVGETFKESARTALSCIRTLPDIKKLPDGYFENHIIHVHVPGCRETVDGTCAGVPIAVALYSAILNKEVDLKAALTGELTIKGIILPVSDAEGKIINTVNTDMKKLIMPQLNRAEVEAIEDIDLSKLNIIYVSRIEEVIENSIVKRSFVLKKTDKEK